MPGTNVPTMVAYPGTQYRRVVMIVDAPIGARLSIFRRHGDVTEKVRGADNYLSVAAQTIFVDYEMPQQVELEYWVESYYDGTNDASAISVIPAFDFGGDAIFDLAHPKGGMTINVESLPDLNYGIQQSVSNVWNRPDPVVVSSVRQMPSGTLNLITLNLDERAALLKIIKNGSVICFAPHKPEYGLPGVVYLSVANVAESRTSPYAIEDSRRFALTVQQVQQPSTQYSYPADAQTWAQFKEADWGEVKDDLWFFAVGV